MRQAEVPEKLATALRLIAKILFNERQKFLLIDKFSFRRRRQAPDGRACDDPVAKYRLFVFAQRRSVHWHRIRFNHLYQQRAWITGNYCLRFYEPLAVKYEHVLMADPVRAVTSEASLTKNLIRTPGEHLWTIICRAAANGGGDTDKHCDR